jgi:two-component system, OmpR family, phosphate regulon response regulator PhoB
MRPDLLVVDDDMPLLRVLALHFETEGHPVRVATGGREALVQVRVRRPDVIILDAMMPVMSGVEVLRQVRHMDHGDDIKVIMLTANPAVEPAAREAGVDAFVTKPFSLPGLSAEVRRLTSGVSSTSVE